MVKRIKYNRLLYKFVNYLKNGIGQIRFDSYVITYYDKKTPRIVMEIGSNSLHIRYTSLEETNMIDGLEREDVIKVIDKLFNPNNIIITTDDKRD